MKKLSQLKYFPYISIHLLFCRYFCELLLRIESSTSKLSSTTDFMVHLCRYNLYKYKKKNTSASLKPNLQCKV